MRGGLEFVVTVVLTFTSILSALAIAAADEARPPEEIAREVRKSVVTISAADRRGETRGLGSGFIVRADGAIATNFHVIGRGRDFTVTLADGSTARPKAILAFDADKDLAVIQIEGKDLPALEIGDSETVLPGQAVLAVGNPLGLKWSVTQGVVAERRDVHGRQLLQVAMPIEPGSSGSPLVDRNGRVIGMIAMKSERSFGFAIPSNDLQALLARPRPIPLSRWLTVAALDTRRWRPVLGGEWRQRAGRFIASGVGTGFGGRMILVHQTPCPPEPFEVSVEVKLEDESGAAGLVFRSDGGEKHYGFYPTNGSLRLTRFEGPDVTSWTILQTVPSPAYRAGEWNEIRVRLEGRRLKCSVNGETAITADDGGLESGLVGLVKFREPGAEFRRFQIGRELPPARVSEETARQVDELTRELTPGRARVDTPEALAALGEAAVRVLEQRALDREREAERLRKLAVFLHARGVQSRLQSVLSAEEDKIDLLEGALLVAKLDNPDLEIAPYREAVDLMAEEVRKETPPDASSEDRLRTLVRVFGELGFHGSGVDYYHRSNSYLNEVLDDREGIPITLSVVFLEIARRVGLDMTGVGAPGHFLVAWKRPEGGRQLIDVFNDGKLISREEAGVLAGRPLDDKDLEPARKSDILARMLQNLAGVAEREGDQEAVLRYLDLIVALNPNSALDRYRRAGARFHLGELEAVAEDLEWLLAHPAPGIDLAETRRLLEILRRGKDM